MDKVLAVIDKAKSVLATVKKVIPVVALAAYTIFGTDATWVTDALTVLAALGVYTFRNALTTNQAAKVKVLD